MVAEHVDDADGELLRRVRDVVGANVPVVASLDFHANLSREMATCATALVSYRTYPHVDMAECGARAARALHDILRGAQVASYLEQIDYLIPLTSQSTLVDPLQSLMREVEAAERAPLAVARHPAGISGRRRGRVRALGVRLRQRRVSTRHDGSPAGGRTAAARK